jgi:hypothetical protein
MLRQPFSEDSRIRGQCIFANGGYTTWQAPVHAGLCGERQFEDVSSPANQQYWTRSNAAVEETVMSKTRILLMEAGVVLEQISFESGQTLLAKVYSVSTKRTPEVWQTGNLEQALEYYNAEQDRCASQVLQR